MTQLFGISKEKLDKIVADNPPSDSMGSNIYGMIAFTIRNALVPIESEKKEECIHNDCLQDEDGDICIAPQKEKKCPQCGNNMANAISAYICSKCFVKITKNQQKQQKEKKEERCTKCNGTGKLDTVRSLTITCGACNGTGKEPKTIQSCTHSSASTCSDCMEEINTKVLDSSHKAAFGKEPRKEERTCPFCGEPVNTNPKNCKGSGHEKRKEVNTFVQFSTQEDALICTKLMENAEAKLSRYKSALEEIADGANRWGDNEYSEIARTALEDTNH